MMAALDGGALTRPLKGRGFIVFLPLHRSTALAEGGGGQEGDGVSAK